MLTNFIRCLDVPRFAVGDVVLDAEVAKVAFPELERATVLLDGRLVRIGELDVLNDAIVFSAIEEFGRVAEFKLGIRCGEGQIPVVVDL